MGAYEVIKEVGRGAFGVVYQARDPQLNRTVALKVLHPYHSDPAFIERFEREARIAAQFSHPHIITVYEVGQDQGRHYLVMAYLAGQTLAQALQAGPLPIEPALTIIEQIAAALEAIHKRGLTHRDVKSSNIMLTDAGRRAVLLDFGLVRAAEGTQLTLTTASGPGTPEYMAPEQIEPQTWGELGPRTDIYALGVVAYELLAGRLPFTAESPLQVMYQHAHTTVPPPTAVKPDLPSGLEAPLLKALAKAPAERYPSTVTFAADLQQAYQVEQHQQQREAHLAPLYQQLQAAREREDWAETLALGGQIQAVSPHYRDVPQLMAEARRQMQPQPPIPRLKSNFPQWLWGAGAGLLFLACLLGLGLRELGNLVSPASTATPNLPAEAVETVAVTLSTERSTAILTATHTPLSPPATSAIGLGSTHLREADGMTMVYVPAGTFLMGSNDHEHDEKPPHQVRLAAFWMDQTEVTNAHYNRCVEAEVCRSSSYADDPDFNGAGYPVVGVSWRDARTYCEWAGSRLPTEAEWEYAARGPERLTYPWGNEFDGTKLNFCDQNCSFEWKANHVGDGYAQAAPAGSYPAGASWAGALDLAGNVWEWVQSEYKPYPYQAADGREKLDSPNPRVMRGGSWNSDLYVTRASDRESFEPDYQNVNVGFRCVVSALE